MGTPLSAAVVLLVILLHHATLGNHGWCDDDEFLCDNGDCVRVSWVCDDINDCGDYSDEDQCDNELCDEFKCDNGDCVQETWVCDGFNDCGDNSDENQCAHELCDDDEFICDNGDCVPQSWVCDGDNDCGDYCDEDQCGYECYAFECDNGNCRSSSDECDGYDDCGDNSDEDDCPGTNVGLAVGLSVGFFILFFIGVPSFICILVFCLIHKQNRRRTVQTRVITTTPSAGEKTVVTSNQNTSFTTPAPVAAPYPTQQPVYKDAKFSNQDTPPSYDVATTFPQGYLHGQPNPMAAYPPQQSAPVQTQATYPGYPPAAPMAYPSQT